MALISEFSELIMEVHAHKYKREVMDKIIYGCNRLKLILTIKKGDV